MTKFRQVSNKCYSGSIVIRKGKILNQSEKISSREEEVEPSRSWEEAGPCNGDVRPRVAQAICSQKLRG
jgi:hypothetical protein